MIHYLDNSTVGEIADSGEGPKCIAALRKCGDRVKVSALNVLEASLVRDQARREALLRLWNELRDGHPILKLPGWILQQWILDARDGTLSPVYCTEGEGVLESLEDPTILRDADVRKLAREQHDAIEGMGGRDEDTVKQFNSILKEYPKQEAKRLQQNPLVLLEALDEDPSLVERFIPQALGRKLGRLPCSGAELCKRSPVWQLQLEAISTRIFLRSLRAGGSSSKPGSVDFAQWVYLAFVDVFVTADMPLHKALLPVVTKRHPTKRVWELFRFRKHLGLS